MFHSIICKKKMHILFFVVFMQSVCLFSSSSLIKSPWDTSLCLDKDRYCYDDQMDNQAVDVPLEKKRQGWQIDYEGVPKLLHQLDRISKVEEEQAIFETILSKVIQKNEQGGYDEVHDEEVAKLRYLYDQQTQAALSVDGNKDSLLLEKYHRRLNVLGTVLTNVDIAKLNNNYFDILNNTHDYKKRVDDYIKKVKNSDLKNSEKFSRQSATDFLQEYDMLRISLPDCIYNNDLISKLAGIMHANEIRGDKNARDKMNGIREDALRAIVKDWQEEYVAACKNQVNKKKLQNLFMKKTIAERVQKKYFEEKQSNVILSSIVPGEHQRNEGGDYQASQSAAASGCAEVDHHDFQKHNQVSLGNSVQSKAKLLQIQDWQQLVQDPDLRCCTENGGEVANGDVSLDAIVRSICDE